MDQLVLRQMPTNRNTCYHEANLKASGFKNNTHMQKKCFYV